MSQTYVIDYDASSAAKASQQIDMIGASATNAEAAVTKLKAAIKGIGKGDVKTLNDLTKAFNALTRASGGYSAAAGKVVAATKQVGSASTTVATQVNGLGTATSSTGRRMTGASANAMAMGKNILAAGQVVGVTAGQMATLATDAQAAGKSMNSVKTSTTGASASMGRFVAYSAAMQGVRKITGELAEVFEDAREYARSTAEEVLALKDQVRELRAITGDKATPANVMNSVKDLMVKTGATSQEAIAFSTMWESALPAAMQNVDEKTGKANWQLDEAQTAEAKVAALRFAVANGIDPATMGRMVPSIGIGQPVANQNDLMGQLGAMHAMAVQGVGTFSPIMKVYNKLRGTMVRPEGGGAAKSSGELLGIISAQTVTAGREAQVTQDINQVWRELSVASSEKKAETFKKFGITPGTDDYVTSVEKIAPLLLASRAEGKSDLDTLKEAGFGNAGANAKIIAAVNNRAVLRSRLNAVGPASDPTRVAAINTQFQQQNPERFGAAAVTAAELGRGEETADVQGMKRFVQASLIREKKIDKEETFGERLEAWTTFGGLMGEHGRNKTLNTELFKTIRKYAPEAGNDDADLWQTRSRGNMKNLEAFALSDQKLANIVKGLNPEQRKAVMADLSGRATGGAMVLGGAGAGAGNPPDPNAKKALDVQQNQLDVLKEIAAKLGGGMSPPLMPPRPNIAGAPPAGGNFNGRRN